MTQHKFNLSVKEVYLLDSAILKGTVAVNECSILHASNNTKPFEQQPHSFLPSSASPRKKMYIIKEK